MNLINFNEQITDEDNFPIIPINARSLSKHFEELTDMVESFSKSIQIIAVSETWIIHGFLNHEMEREELE